MPALTLPEPRAAANRGLRALAFFGALAALGALGVPTCMFALCTGQPCPGCGMTRAAVALAHGDLALATAQNPTALLTVPVSAGLVAFFALSYVYDGKLRAGHGPAKWLAIGTIALLTVVWIARALGAFGGPVSV